MRRVKLDRIDLHILKDLQEDGRITNVDLARRAGISAPPCGELLGFDVTFFALIGLDSQSEVVLSSFERTMAEWPEVRECHMARGPHDFVLKVVARNTAHENQLTTKLTGVPHVVTVQTIQVIQTAKSMPGVPIEMNRAVSGTHADADQE